jgi:hypothetical protein
MQTGTLVHTGISEYFRGSDPVRAIALEAATALHQLSTHPTGNREKDDKLYKELEAAIPKAISMTNRYIAMQGNDFKATLVEPELKWGNVVCHPDLIAYLGDSRVVVDFKTSSQPEFRWLDISGQADLYAVVLEKLNPSKPVDLVIYDVISDEGNIARIARPPRYSTGNQLLSCISELALSEADGDAHIKFPHCQYTCPARCEFFESCWLMTTDSDQAAYDYLKQNFIKQGEEQ